jgi:hypothetical protein
MKHEALIERLATTCLGLDAVDPLRLLVDDVIAALREPEQEPVGSVVRWFDGSLIHGWFGDPPPEGTLLYSTPPKRPWVGLTLEQYIAINCSCTTVDQAVGSTERQLKENNK